MWFDNPPHNGYNPAEPLQPRSGATTTQTVNCSMKMTKPAAGKKVAMVAMVAPTKGGKGKAKAPAGKMKK
jgi:hypothetical protein